MLNPDSSLSMLCRRLFVDAGVVVPTVVWCLSSAPRQSGTCWGGGLFWLFWMGVTLPVLLVAGCLGLRSAQVSSAESRGTRRLLAAVATFFYAIIVPPGHHVPWGWSFLALLGPWQDAMWVVPVMLAGFLCVLVALRRGPALAHARWLTVAFASLGAALAGHLLYSERAQLLVGDVLPAAIAMSIALANAWGKVLFDRGRAPTGGEQLAVSAIETAES